MCSVLTSLVFHKKDKAFAIYSGEFCSSFVLFDRVFRSLSMTSIRGSIHQGHEAFSEHSRGRQCAFMSLSALLFNRSDSVDSWTQTDIDAILFHGDRMYYTFKVHVTMLF
jgi:hypothetical protein